MNQAERRRFLIEELLKENAAMGKLDIPEESREQDRLLRGLMNIRPAGRSKEEFLRVQDAYLSGRDGQEGDHRSGFAGSRAGRTVSVAGRYHRAQM